MSKSSDNEIKSPGKPTLEPNQKGIVFKGLATSKDLISKTGKSLVQNTVDFAIDISRRGATEIIDDPFPLDTKVQDHFGSGNIKIVLKNQNFIPSTFARLAKNDESLKELSFCNIELNWKEFNLLALAIQHSKTLKKLTFYKSDINDGNAKELAKGITKNSGLEALVFHHNRLTEKGSCSLFKAIGQNKTINTIGFFKNKMGENAMESLREAARDNPKIDSIHLFKNETGHCGSNIMASMMQSRSDYISLSMSYNNLGDTGTFAIAEQLKSQKSLLNFSLSGNGIGINGAHSLVEGLKHCPTIVKLDLSGNKMKDDGCLEIVEQLVSKESSLKELDLSYNEISNVGALSILKRLQQNTSLQALKLKESELKNDAISRQITTLMQRNRCLSEDKTEVDESDEASTSTLTNTVDNYELLGENVKFVLGRYIVENYPSRPMHKSDKSRVYSAVDFHADPFSDHRRVALRFFDKREDFEKELCYRLTSRSDLTSGNDLIFKDKQNTIQNKNKFDDNYVIPIIRFHEDEYCIAMPLGGRNLEEIIRYEALAGNDLEYIRDTMKSIALSIRHLHEEHKMMHGDVRPLNFVRHNGQLKISDFQEATSLNDSFETIRSTGYVAPELAKGIFLFENSKNISYWANEEKKIMKKILKLDRTNEQHQDQIQQLEQSLQKVRPHLRRNSLAPTTSRLDTEDTYVASAALDVWSFGVLSYYFLAGSHLFACDQQDNIYTSDTDEQEKLVFWSGLTDVAKSRISFHPDSSSQVTTAIDLLHRCLHPDRTQRIPNMNEVLNHAFFSENCHQSTCMDEASISDVPKKIPVEHSPFISFHEKAQRKLSMKSVMSSLSIHEFDDKNPSLFDPEYSTSVDIDILSAELNVRKKVPVGCGIFLCLKR